MVVTKECIIKCPHCKVEQESIMPENSCQIAYDCSACMKIIVRVRRYCCVFCSYGSVKCPPKQINGYHAVARQIRF